MKHFAFVFLLLLLPHPSLASWNWYVGDLVPYTLYPPDQLSNHFQDALNKHLDYRIFYTPPTESPFSGLANFLEEEDFNYPAIFTPLLGTAIALDSIQTTIFVGVDPRSPIPTTNETRYHWATSQGGVSIATQLPSTFQSPYDLPDRAMLFQALTAKGWHPHIEINGRWDSLLTVGYRIGIVGNALQRTSVWAESTQPDHLFAGFNNLATTVTDEPGIMVDFRVDGEVPGTILLSEETITIRIKATAPTPIEHVRLISDGEVIWSIQPNTSTVSTRVQLPKANMKYIRAECETALHHARTSPVFLASEFDIESIDLPFEEVPLHLTLDAVLESLALLPLEAQARILSEYISHTQTQFAMALTLENRTDIISDALIETLSMSPFPQVRLGAAFVRVLRNAPTLSSHLEHLLSDPAPTIQTYAARMLLQYTPPQDWPPLSDQINFVTPRAQAYLIQTLDPNNFDQSLHQSLIHITRTPNLRVASAATAKLVDMGNRNFRVIRTLIDSARASHLTSLNILGTIGDERTANDIEKIYLNALPSQLKNTAFHILQSFHPNQDYYPQRPEIHDKGATPSIDGTLFEEEWHNAAHINQLVDDTHLGQVYDSLNVYFSRDQTHLYFGIHLPKLDSDSLQSLELSLATTLAPEIPFVFNIPYSTAEDTSPDPTLHLKENLSTAGWTVEGRLAFSELGLDPTVPVPYLRLNISLITNHNRWTWTPTYGRPNNPQRFGNLHLHTPRE